MDSLYPPSFNNYNPNPNPNTRSRSRNKIHNDHKHDRPSSLRATTTPIKTLNKLLTDDEVLSATTIEPQLRGRSRPPTSSLCTWEQLADWQRDNHFIRTHYRPASYSYGACIQSLFYLHNESVNIHSHLLGAVLFLSIAVSVALFEATSSGSRGGSGGTSASASAGIIAIRGGGLTSADALAFGCFFLGAVACLGVSAGFHLISNHSAEVNRLGNQFDYVGIVALITGSFVPSVYYGFWCEPVLQRVYWLMVGPFPSYSSPPCLFPKKPQLDIQSHL